MSATEGRETWGVLGGMGPLASAEFLRTIYEESLTGPEQESPVVVLLSDPTVPDRTTCLLDGREEQLLKHFSSAMERLIGCGVDHVVIACFTIHPLVPRLPEAWRRKIISLVDVTLECVRSSDRRHLLLCTKGSRALGLFERHELWPVVKEKIVFPDDEDQELVHRMVYELKGSESAGLHIKFVEDMLRRYGVSSYIAGCTELHIFAKEHQRARGIDRREFCIDALSVISTQMARSGVHVAAVS